MVIITVIKWFCCTFENSCRHCVDRVFGLLINSLYTRRPTIELKYFKWWLFVVGSPFLCWPSSVPLHFTGVKVLPCRCVNVSGHHHHRHGSRQQHYINIINRINIVKIVNTSTCMDIRSCKWCSTVCHRAHGYRHRIHIAHHQLVYILYKLYYICFITKFPFPSFEFIQPWPIWNFEYE